MQTALLAGLLELSGELGAAIDLHDGDTGGHAVQGIRRDWVLLHLRLVGNQVEIAYPRQPSGAQCTVAANPVGGCGGCGDD